MSNVKIGFAIAGAGAALALVLIAAGLFIESGIYNIGADDHHTKTALALIEQLREHSIDVRDRGIELRYVEDSQRIAAGEHMAIDTDGKRNDTGRFD